MANGEPLSRLTRHALINPDLTLPVRVLSFTQISDCNPTKWEGWTEKRSADSGSLPLRPALDRTDT
jgi:hypothetical protein